MQKNFDNLVKKSTDRIKFDENKHNNTHTAVLNNVVIGLIEQFYEVNSTKFAVFKKLEKEYFNFKISRDNQDLSTALLKINESLIF